MLKGNGVYTARFKYQFYTPKPTPPPTTQTPTTAQVPTTAQAPTTTPAPTTTQAPTTTFKYQFYTPKPTPSPTTQPTTARPTPTPTSPPRCPSMLRLITNLSHTNCMWQPLSPLKQTACTPALSPLLQIHVRTSSASVVMFQQFCVQLRNVNTTSSAIAAVHALPPVASCVVMKVHTYPAYSHKPLWMQGEITKLT